MSADTGTDGAVTVDGVAAAYPAAAAGQRVYSSWLDGRIDRVYGGRWQAGIGVTYGTVEIIGDRWLVRHGATYEDLGEQWYTTEAAARAAKADVILEMAAGLLEQAARLRSRAAVQTEGL